MVRTAVRVHQRRPVVAAGAGRHHHRTVAGRVLRAVLRRAVRPVVRMVVVRMRRTRLAHAAPHVAAARLVVEHLLALHHLVADDLLLGGELLLLRRLALALLRIALPHQLAVDHLVVQGAGRGPIVRVQELLHALGEHVQRLLALVLGGQAGQLGGQLGDLGVGQAARVLQRDLRDAGRMWMGLIGGYLFRNLL